MRQGEPVAGTGSTDALENPRPNFKHETRQNILTAQRFRVMQRFRLPPRRDKLSPAGVLS